MVSAMTGKIIFLNGTSSAGKTSIAKALQTILDELYIRTGIDHFLSQVPEAFHYSSNGQGSDSDFGFQWIFSKEKRRLTKILLGPAGLALINGLYGSAAALAAAGNNLIIDDVLFDERALPGAVRALHPFSPLFVGVQCPLDVANQREGEREGKPPGLAEAHFDIVHSHGIYDLEVDTSVASPMACAEQIKAYLENNSEPRVFGQLLAVYSDGESP